VLRNRLSDFAAEASVAEFGQAPNLVGKGRWNSGAYRNQAFVLCVYFHDSFFGYKRRLMRRLRWRR
jgi:hypothetical protein